MISCIHFLYTSCHRWELCRQQCFAAKNRIPFAPPLVLDHPLSYYQLISLRVLLQSSDGQEYQLNPPFRENLQRALCTSDKTPWQVHCSIPVVILYNAHTKYVVLVRKVYFG